MDQLNTSENLKILQMKDKIEPQVQQQIVKEKRSGRKVGYDFALRIAGAIVGVKGALTNENFVEELREITNYSELKSIIVVAVLLVFDNYMFKLLMKTKKFMPGSIGAQLVDLLSKLGSSIGLFPNEIEAKDLIFESFYIAALSSNYSRLNVSAYNFDSLTNEEKIGYANHVIIEAIAKGITFEKSTVAAYNVSKDLGRLYERFRTFYLIYHGIIVAKSQKHFDIKTGRVFNIISEKIKMLVMKISKFSGKLRFIIRGLLDLVVGPLLLAAYNRATKRVGNEVKKVAKFF